MKTKRLLNIFINDDCDELVEYLKETDDVEQTLKNPPKIYSLLTDSPPLISVAAFFGAFNCFQYLNMNDASLDHLDLKKRHPVHFASCGGNMDILDLMDSQSCDFSITDAYNVTCMHFAAQFGHINVVNRFWQRNFSMYAKDSLGRNAIHYSAFSDNTDVIEFFRSKGADLNTKSGSGTPFCIAVKSNSYNIVKYLIEKNIDPNQFVNKNETALMYSIRKNYDQISQCIIENSKRIDQANDDGWTALHFAASLGKRNICDLLIKYDANINATTKFGTTPLLLSKNHHFSELSEYLEKEGASLRSSNHRTFNFHEI